MGKKSDIKLINQLTTPNKFKTFPSTKTIVSYILTMDNFFYNLIEYPEINKSIKGVLVTSSTINSQQCYACEIANVSKKVKVIKEGKMLVACAPLI